MIKELVLGASLLYAGAAQAQDYSVVNVSSRVYNNAHFLYKTVKGSEYILHLGGRVENDTLHVTSAHLPRIKYYSDKSISAEEPFIDDYVGTIHSHPGKAACVPSVTDVKTFFEDSQARVMGVACDKGLAFYNKQSLKEIDGLEELVE